ncbi:MAG: hypothetical protein C0514_08400 [Candidatus Puniceispirillum sp.]|nr:hypothetical protein [Candidatus Puniceispirillum sp.]
MLRILKRILIVAFVFTGIFPKVVNVIPKTFPTRFTSDLSRINASDLAGILCFLNGERYKTALTLRDGEYLNYTKLNIKFVLSDESVSLIKNQKSLENVDIVINNSYNDPFFYKTWLKDVLYNQERSCLVYDDLGYQVFDVKKSFQGAQCTKFAFNASLSDVQDKFNIYATHVKEFPYLTTLPAANGVTFPKLDEGLYDVLLTADCDATKPQKIDFAVLTDGVLHNLSSIKKDTFYLEKGKNKISTRFVHSNIPFRGLFLSKDNVELSNITVKFCKIQNSFSKLFQLYPKTYTGYLVGNTITVSSSFLLENKENTAKQVTLKVSGDGVLATSLIGDGIVESMAVRLSKLLGNALMKRLENSPSYHIVDEEESEVSVQVAPHSKLILSFTLNPAHPGAQFKISSLKIS